MTDQANKPREFWINDIIGGASEAEESIQNGYNIHVIEYSAFQAERDKVRKLV